MQQPQELGSLAPWLLGPPCQRDRGGSGSWVRRPELPLSPRLRFLCSAAWSAFHWPLDPDLPPRPSVHPRGSFLGGDHSLEPEFKPEWPVSHLTSSCCSGRRSLTMPGEPRKRRNEDTSQRHQLQGAQVLGRGGKLGALSSSRGDRRAKQSLKCSQRHRGPAFANAAAMHSKPTGRAWLPSGRPVIICAQQSGTRVSQES